MPTRTQSTKLRSVLSQLTPLVTVFARTIKAKPTLASDVCKFIIKLMEGKDVMMINTQSHKKGEEDEFEDMVDGKSQWLTT